MIRVRKSKEEPANLATKGYGDDEVKKTLLDDQDEKCYLCERRVGLDYEVEHLESQKGAEDKVDQWDNLFLACSYCNNRKKNNYDDIPHPNAENWEDIIKMRVDALEKKVVIETDLEDAGVKHMVKLLDVLHNGKDEKMRNLKESRFWNLLKDSYSEFIRHIEAYIDNPCEETKKLVKEDLDIKSEFLAIKYQKILSLPQLASVFEEDMKWNRK